MIRTHSCGELRSSHEGEKATLSGWTDTYRITGKISFILLRDRTGITQVFLNKELTEQFKNELKPESVIQITGKVNKRPENQVKEEMPTGEIELEAEEIEILSRAETPLPIDLSQETETSIDKRLDYRFLDVRKEKIKSIFTVRSKIFGLTAEFFPGKGFVNIQTPKLTEAGVESGAEEFKIPYFGKTASLAQSPQVYKQMFVISGLERVYEIAPVFRAEKSHTTRHLTEFTGIDFEMGFIEDERDVMKIVDEYFQYLFTKLPEVCKEELKVLEITVPKPATIPIITIGEASEILAKEYGKKIPENDDLDAEAEKLIGKYAKTKFDSDLLFVTEYPWKKRPFYHMRPDDKTKTKSFDLIYKGVEIGTGAQREHRLNVLEEQAKEKGIDLKQMEFYRNIFRYGCPPHGGIGIGLDRIVEQLLELGNVREAVLLPRDPERLGP
jgi:aspartyl-tRNA synthetase